MAGFSGFALLLVFCVGLTILVQAQQQRGFISIDCGIPDNFQYTDIDTDIKYNSDGGYIQTGVSKNISSEYAYPKNPILPQPLSDLRSFPQGDRNCYRLISAIRGSLHLIRASFLYGNYDGLNKLPEFDLYVGPNFWSSVTFRNASEELMMEIIIMAQSDVINVCLVNKGLGTPFISALELRPIFGSIYNYGFGESASLLLFRRWNFGALNESTRFEDDIYDRIWLPYNSSSWDSIRTSSLIDVNADGYSPPFEVISTAARPKNVNGTLEFSWTPSDPNSKFYIYLYFAEVDRLQKTQLRKFNVLWNGSPLFERVVPRYLSAATLTNSKPLVANQHRISIQKTNDSTLPPILNAAEIYVVRELNTLPTLEQDVDAMMNIKGSYGVQRNWMGDPCEPRNYSWKGISCNYSTSLPPQIISLDLSSSSLSGIIAPSIANLSSLESLNLSNNSLSGPIPQFLEELRFLTYLNLQGNQLSGSISTTLYQRSRDGLLKLSVDDQNMCAWDDKKNKKKIIVPIVATLLSVIALSAAFILIWKLRRKKRSDEEMNKHSSGGRNVASKNWQYTYSEVLGITKNFEKVIGKGGFGTVYCGKMRDDSQVAVKVFSPSSSQGPKEFQTEAELLMTVHHKNLVSFIGYCDDDNKMTLIYEYMANGNLKDYLSDKNPCCLDWERRLQIAIDAAEGLDYLHHGCKPPIIHRDVKSSNILLNEELEAKIADFGLSKVFKNENRNSVPALIQNDNKIAESTVMGTTGYLDPEYFKLRNLNEKSDIYSFGIVLLELITGRPAVLKGEHLMHIIDWLRPELEKGDLSRIMDPRLQGKYDAGSAWKALGTAISCTAPTSIQRPTMSVVLSELKQCFKTELPSSSETIVIPKQIYSEFSSSEAYSMDSDSMSYPFPR